MLYLLPIVISVAYDCEIDLEMRAASIFDGMTCYDIASSPLIERSTALKGRGAIEGVCLPDWICLYVHSLCAAELSDFLFSSYLTLLFPRSDKSQTCLPSSDQMTLPVLRPPGTRMPRTERRRSVPLQLHTRILAFNRHKSITLPGRKPNSQCAAWYRQRRPRAPLKLGVLALAPPGVSSSGKQRFLI